MSNGKRIITVGLPLALIISLIAGCSDTRQAEEIASLRRSNAALKDAVTSAEKRRVIAEADTALARAERDLARSELATANLRATTPPDILARIDAATVAAMSTVPLVTTSVKPNYYDADGILTVHCAKEWPSDFHMRVYCEKEQREGVAALRGASAPPGMSGSDFITITDHCADEWPNDFHMSAYCEKKQIEGWRKTHGG